MKLKVNQRPSGATTAHLALTGSEALILTPRQREDLALGLFLLDAALRPDEAFLSDNPVGRALEVRAAHELAEIAASESKERQ